MIIIEASHISFGGGLELLKLIINHLEEKQIEAHVYLGYPKVFDLFTRKNLSFVKFEQTTNLNTIVRYFKRRNGVLFFCNLPPFRKNRFSVTYFHNVLLLKKSDSLKITPLHIKLRLYYYWVKYFSSKTTYVACQTLAVKDLIEKRNQLDIRIIPFFEKFDTSGNSDKYDFCYICSPEEHKNLPVFFEAVSLVGKRMKLSIAVTLEETIKSEPYLELLNYVNDSLGYKAIINVGFISKKEIKQLYCDSKSLIFPSIKESFGLPLIEAVMSNTLVLASDLPYTHQILNNPVLFNPLDKMEISIVMENLLKGKYSTIEQSLKIESKIDELIDLLIEN